jgi:hypothetical protein
MSVISQNWTPSIGEYLRLSTLVDASRAPAGFWEPDVSKRMSSIKVPSNVKDGASQHRQGKAFRNLERQRYTFMQLANRMNLEQRFGCAPRLLRDPVSCSGGALLRH